MPLAKQTSAVSLICARLKCADVTRSYSIDKFLVEAGNAAFFDENASVHEALRKLGLKALFQPLPGMEVALMPHQAIGVAWMLEKERNPTYRGGILADDMGLGKVSYSTFENNMM